MVTGSRDGAGVGAALAVGDGVGAACLRQAPPRATAWRPGSAWRWAAGDGVALGTGDGVAVGAAIGCRCLRGRDVGCGGPGLRAGHGRPVLGRRGRMRELAECGTGAQDADRQVRGRPRRVVGESHVHRQPVGRSSRGRTDVGHVERDGLAGLQVVREGSGEQHDRGRLRALDGGGGHRDGRANLLDLVLAAGRIGPLRHGRDRLPAGVRDPDGHAAAVGRRLDGDADRVVAPDADVRLRDRDPVGAREGGALDVDHRDTWSR